MIIDLIEKLQKNKYLSKEEYLHLLNDMNDPDKAVLLKKARETSRASFGNKIYIRGLIEFTNHCKNNCYYCGIRTGNKSVKRYRLTEEEILSCCENGYNLGFRTFVLQGGEDPYFTDEKMIGIISKIRSTYSDCAITLSIGERSKNAYQSFFSAGANRFLLRHETASAEHYNKLHPKELALETRMNCLRSLKEIGFQTGTGIMVGSPFQTLDNIADDLVFIEQLQPEMVGIGPFLPHHATPFKDYPAGSVDLCVTLLGIIRLMLPHCLIPATTALASAKGSGRKKGILAGANVVMPNLSPLVNRKNYSLYDNKAFTDAESALALDKLSAQLGEIGYEIGFDRGDFVKTY